MNRDQRRIGLAHLLVVYLTWGSTFLAIRQAVQGEGSFAPFWLAGFRVGASGLLLLAFAKLRGHQLLVPNRLLLRLAVVGNFLWFGGHALLIWAAQWADSGFAAIIFASIPLWSAIIEAFKNPRARSARLLAPVLTGFFGIVLLSFPQVANHDGVESQTLLTALVLLLSAFCWALGSTLHTHEMDRLSVSVSAGLQQIFAGLVCVLVALSVGETVGVPSARATLSLAYLITFGSLLAFTSFVRAQQLLPDRLVASFAYVNPVIAVGLGYVFLDEKISVWMVAGTIVVIASVIWLFRLEKGNRHGETF